MWVSQGAAWESWYRSYSSVQVERLDASNAMWSGCGWCAVWVRASMVGSRVGRQGLVELGSQLIGGREGALGWLPSWKAQDGGQARSATNTFLGLPQPAPGPTSPNLPVSEAHGSLGQALGHQRASPVSARLSRGFEVSSQLIGLTSPAGSAAGARSITNTPHQQARPARAAWSRARWRTRKRRPWPPPHQPPAVSSSSGGNIASSERSAREALAIFTWA